MPLQPTSPTPAPPHLTTLSVHLIRCALGPHLALDLAHLAPSRARRALGLLHLLLALRRRLLLLALPDRCLTGGGAGFGPLGAALFDDIEGGADDGSLVLYGAAGTLFGDFLVESKLDISGDFTVWQHVVSGFRRRSPASWRLCNC